MKPKEKAKELFMRNFEITVDDYCDKNCALIAVDEILNDDWYITTLEDLAERRKYWRQVKQEIEKL